PATPSRGIPQPTPQPAPQRPGFFGSLMGGIAGFALGGLLGSLLFGGGFGGGIGLLEILLVVGGVFLLMRMIRGRQSAPEPAYAGAGASAYGASDPGGSGGGARAAVAGGWQEGGQDWVTVDFAVALVDYTVDDASGNVVDGSRTRQDIEEYWTFTRPVGANPWRLSAIQTA